MTIDIDPEVATAVSNAIHQTGDTMLCTGLAEPTGCGWSQSFAKDAQWVAQECHSYLTGVVLGIADQTKDSALGFVIADEVGRGYFRNGWAPH